VAAPRPQIVLIRHGQTPWTLTGQHTGHTDLPLTDAGRADARLLGAGLAVWPDPRVLTSPLSRAAETCRLAGFGDRAEVLDDLKEWDYGAYEGRTTPDIRTERPDWSLWRDGVPDGESPEEAAARADRVLQVIGAPDRHTLVFAHGHILRVLAARWLGLPVTGGRLLALAPTTISVLGHEREQPVIVRWNDRAHLDHPADPIPEIGTEPEEPAERA
jgi:broad specificity phosphatase PhoE